MDIVLLFVFARVGYLWLCLRGWWRRVLAGSIAGFSIMALNDSNRRRTLALYLLARLAQVFESASPKWFLSDMTYMDVFNAFLVSWKWSASARLIHILVYQCAYNSAKSKNKFHLWGSHWRHGDSLLFALACAQVLIKPQSDFSC